MSLYGSGKTVLPYGSNILGNSTETVNQKNEA